jgi:NADH dehydrogenase
MTVNEGTMKSHHVVVIGSGFGGLFSAKALKDAPVDVTVIAKTNHHLFQPLLYQVATGILRRRDRTVDAGDPSWSTECRRTTR